MGEGVWRKRNFWELFHGTLSLIYFVLVVKEIKSLFGSDGHLFVKAKLMWKISLVIVLGDEAESG